MAVVAMDAEKLQVFDVATGGDLMYLSTEAWSFVGWGGEHRAAAARHVHFEEGLAPNLLYGVGVHRPREYELEGWVTGVDLDTGRGSVSQFKKNWRELRRRLQPIHSPLVGFRREVDGVAMRCICVLLDPIVPISTGPGRATITARYVMQKAYWVSETIDQLASEVDVVSTSFHQVTVDGEGDWAPVVRVSVEALASATGVTISHRRGSTVLTTGHVTLGEATSIHLDTAERTLDIGNHRVDWSAGWPMVENGDTIRVQLSGSGATGSLTVDSIQTYV